MNTQEARDRIVKEVIESLTLYLAANGQSLAFPELVVPITVLLRKFKKQVNSSNYKKNIQSFLDVITRQENYVAQNRAKIKDKSLRDPAKLFQQFSQIIQSQTTGKDGQSTNVSPLDKE